MHGDVGRTCTLTLKSTSSLLWQKTVQKTIKNVNKKEGRVELGKDMERS